MLGGLKLYKRSSPSTRHSETAAWASQPSLLILQWAQTVMKCLGVNDSTFILLLSGSWGFDHSKIAANTFFGGVLAQLILPVHINYVFLQTGWFDCKNENAFRSYLAKQERTQLLTIRNNLHLLIYLLLRGCSNKSHGLGELCEDERWAIHFKVKLMSGVFS